jgi:hypothetical protein
MRSLSTAQVLQILGALGEIEWGRFAVGATSDGRSQPPVIVVRFADGRAADRLAEAVRSYRGAVSWVADNTRRNLVIWPRRVEELFESGRWRTDAELCLELADEDREFSVLSAADAVGLMSHVEKAIEGAAEQPDRCC